MPEQGDKASLEERMAVCPIHQWADIDDYLRRVDAPESMRRPFHELVVARGSHPKNLSVVQSESFGKEAVDITNRYEGRQVEVTALRLIFRQLITRWVSSLGSQTKCNTPV